MSTHMRARAQILKQYEVDCYAACLYVFQDEKQAVQAAANVMTRLLRDGKIDRICETNRHRYIRDETIRYCLKETLLHLPGNFSSSML